MYSSYPLQRASSHDDTSVPFGREKSFKPHDPNEALSDSETYRMHRDDFDDMFKRRNDLSSTKTGRQRRKIAARVVGGDFQEILSKRRLYFCGVGSEINLEQMYEDLQTIDTWDLKQYADVLRLFRHESKACGVATVSPHKEARSTYAEDDEDMDPKSIEKRRSLETLDRTEVQMRGHARQVRRDQPRGEIPAKIKHILSALKNQTTSAAQEVYIFEFGSIVFWGFTKGDELLLRNFIEHYVTHGKLTLDELAEAEDDIGFVTSPEATAISIVNDVITMPENVVEKQRLAVSYAIGQATILAIYEARVERKVAEYKYIPDVLAKSGAIHLSNTKIGKMIGSIFVVRHDINLHTVVLDTPDWFWKEERYEIEYRMTMRYFEMTERVDIVNKRLDMLQDLLGVLRKQQDRDNATKLEWVIIVLIVVQIFFEYPIFYRAH
mmetsp:Transcript_11032/g.11043  ORF Transcript_11032/g.11043 Transcript_11032/m.11043 type:complete len:437 (+) Transcript_11032:27-1337(+)